MRGQQPRVGNNAREPANIDPGTVASFGDEWSRHDQAGVSGAELDEIFEAYFSVFPWEELAPDAEGFDMGCGSGRWAKRVAPRVGRLNCIDASGDALKVARSNLAGMTNVNFIHATANDGALADGSQDFGYSLGVLHHIPDTEAALQGCVRMLKPGAPFLVYLYYRFDNRPAWFRLIWQASEVLRSGIRRLPPVAKGAVTDVLAAVIYYPLARMVLIAERLGFAVGNLPLSAYRDKSFYTMRTDSRDRFGTPLEQRFTKSEIAQMMERAGLRDIRFRDGVPYWCAVGNKAYSTERSAR